MATDGHFALFRANLGFLDAGVVASPVPLPGFPLEATCECTCAKPETREVREERRATTRTANSYTTNSEDEATSTGFCYNHFKCL
jgi:hypothetical protein